MINPSRRNILLGAGMGLAATFAAKGEGGAGKSSPAGSGAAALPPSDPRDLPARDRRLEIRTLDTPRTPPVFKSRGQWEARAARLREQALAAAGLLPMPERTPLKPQIFDRLEGEGFTVEKVFFESYPRFFCTGNLYRPRGGNHRPPYPGILNPHGHWSYGRLVQSPGDPGGSAIPLRCVNFALQGYVSFAYDMVGYNDSFQVPHTWGADPKGAWGLSREGERLRLWGITLLGLQLWNSLRALDFLASLPDVDRERLAVTGASGGGTQTFLLTAVDDRVRVSAPVNMISHFMQGGCICENAPNLRIDTDNMEIGALAAPRPLLMVSAMGDWTRDTERIEYPAIASIYELFGARSKVAHRQFPFLHNYNRPSREAVYTFFNFWLSEESSRTESPKPEQIKKVEEQGEFDVDPGRLLVFSRRQPPADACSAAELADYLMTSARRQLEDARPKTVSDLETYRKRFGPAYRTALMAESPSRQELRWWPLESARHAGPSQARRERVIVSRAWVGDRLPVEIHQAVKRAGMAVLIVHPEGAKAALGSRESVSPLTRELSQRHCQVLSADLFQTGEARDPARKMEGKFFPAYNRTDDMQRVQDILTALVYLEASAQPARIGIVGQDVAGLWCLLARPFFPKPYPVAADVAGFESGSDDAYLEKLRVPLLRRAGDFQTAALLAAPSPLLLYNLGGKFSGEAFSNAYSLQGASARLRIESGEVSAAEIAAWLAKFELR
jgi:dienelactone hydrolase